MALKKKKIELEVPEEVIEETPVPEPPKAESEPEQGPVKQKSWLDKSLKETLAPIKERIRQNKIKTWIVHYAETPYEYEYVDAVSAKEAIALSPYTEKADLFAEEKPKYNVFIIDAKNGSHKAYIDEKKLLEQLPDAKQFMFEGDGPMYYLVRQYNDDKKTSKLVEYDRPTEVLVSPDNLYDARNWKPDIAEMIKTKDIISLEKLQAPLLLGLLGLLILLFVIMSDL